MTSCSVRIMEKMGERLKRQVNASAYRWSGGITSTALVAFYFNFFAVVSQDAQSKGGEGDHGYGRS